MLEKECIVCQKVFKCHKSEWARRKFCGRECYYRTLIGKTGEKHNRYGTKHSQETLEKMKLAQATVKERWGK